MAPAGVISSGTGLIDTALSKSKLEDHKWWLNRVEKDNYLDYSQA